MPREIAARHVREYWWGLSRRYRALGMEELARWAWFQGAPIDQEYDPILVPLRSGLADQGVMIGYGNLHSLRATLLADKRLREERDGRDTPG